MGGSQTLSLSGGTQETYGLLHAGVGSQPSTSAEIQLSRASRPLFHTLILTLMPILSNALAEAVIKFWYGVRKVQLSEDGTAPAYAAGTMPSLEMDASSDQRHRWYWRDCWAGQLNATAANVSIIGVPSDSGSGRIKRYIRIGEKFEEYEGLVLQCRWEVIGGGAPNADLAVHYESELKVWVA